MSYKLLLMLALGVVSSYSAVRAELRIVMPEDDAGREIRNVASALMDKIGDGDLAGAKELFAGADDEAELLAAYVDWVRSFEGLNKRLIKKFGNEELGKGLPPIGQIM